MMVSATTPITKHMDTVTTQLNMVDIKLSSRHRRLNISHTSRVLVAESNIFCTGFPGYLAVLVILVVAAVLYTLHRPPFVLTNMTGLSLSTGKNTEPLREAVK